MPKSDKSLCWYGTKTMVQPTIPHLFPIAKTARCVLLKDSGSPEHVQSKEQVWRRVCWVLGVWCVKSVRKEVLDDSQGHNFAREQPSFSWGRNPNKSICVSGIALHPVSPSLTTDGWLSYNPTADLWMTELKVENVELLSPLAAPPPRGLRTNFVDWRKWPAPVHLS